jgi:hypothetical protein
MPEYVTHMDVTYTIYNEEGNDIYTDYDQTRIETAVNPEMAIFQSKQHYTSNPPPDCIEIVFSNESVQQINN